MDQRCRYQLRRAAGVYWLLDMEQDGLSCERPIMLNECGAFLWQRFRDGKTKEAAVQELCAEYEIPPERAKADVERFIGQLKEQGIL